MIVARVIVAAVVLTLLPAQPAQSAGPIVVNSTSDPGDGVCDATECTLREAIDTANVHAGSDVISIQIGAGGAQTIIPTSPLPAIADPVTLDATTQPGFAGMPLIELNGALAGDADGLMVTAGDSTIRGFVIGGFARNGVFVLGGNGNAITGNFIGTDISGSSARPNNGAAGILVIDSANNVIGGSTATLRNVLSGNHHGVYITGVASSGNVLVGNYIGVDASGLHALGNVPAHGVVIDAASNNRIGGLATGEGNVISANGFYGIEIRRGFFAPFDPATANVVQGNYIGLDATGGASLGNGFAGVGITNTAGNIVGGTSPAARNVISGNHNAGVAISQAGATSNVVQGNYIGTDATGSFALGNEAGVEIGDAANNFIGGVAPGAGNVIAANGLGGGPGANAGVAIGGAGATGNVVQGNLIGTNAAGTSALGNNAGVQIGSPNNLIGGAAPGARNVIAASLGPGVGMFSSAATGNRIQGNFIGTDVTGMHPLANNIGVFLCCGAGGDVIGGAAPGEGNTIAASRQDGIALGGSCCNVIQGNYIGTNAAGVVGLGNTNNGIRAGSSSANTIGGTAAGARNVISGNGGNGIFITSNFLSNTIQGNYIGVDPTGSRSLPNLQQGVQISGGNGNQIGGTATGAGNLISGNGGFGVSVTSGAHANVIQQNRIGTDVTGMAPIANGHDGIVFAGASDNVVGGTAANAGNQISGNGTNGILLTAATTRTTIAGNLIGTNALGVAPVANGFAGIAVSGGSTATQIGGTIASARNVVSGNGQGGINVHSGSGASILGNSIAANNSLGIDLNSDGVTLNDQRDADAGPNALQNFPIVTSAISRGGAGTIRGRLPSTPSTSFRVEVFANASCDPSGYGEGESYLGLANVTTNPAGNGTFAIEAAFTPGVFITATATDADGNSSEFAKCAQATDETGEAEGEQ